jgi:hypothetical protein
MWYLALFFLPIAVAVIGWWLLLLLFRFLENMNFWLSAITTAWLERAVSGCCRTLEQFPARLLRTFRRMRRSKIRAFVSSTQADLRLERFIVILELSGDYEVVCMEWHERQRAEEVEALGLPPASMERYASDYEYAVSWSRPAVESSDIVIYLMGRRLGSMTMTLFGRKNSLVDSELHWARAVDVPVLAYRLKHPLDDEAELRRRYNYMRDSIAPAEVEPYERLNFLEQITLTSAAGKGMLPEQIEEITSGAVRRVRRDVDAIAANIQRQILVLQLALFAVGAWFTWCLVQGLANP